MNADEGCGNGQEYAIAPRKAETLRVHASHWDHIAMAWRVPRISNMAILPVNALFV
jgi:hypothetical protein